MHVCCLKHNILSYYGLGQSAVVKEVKRMECCYTACVYIFRALEAPFQQKSVNKLKQGQVLVQATATEHWA